MSNNETAAQNAGIAKMLKISKLERFNDINQPIIDPTIEPERPTALAQLTPVARQCVDKN